MEKKYKQLTIQERCEIARLRASGQSLRQIAATLDRMPSTISRELARNTGQQIGYDPVYADKQTKARRWCGSKLLRRPVLQKQVLDLLAAGWSPEQVAGRLAREKGCSVISYETIYRFIDAQIRRTKDYRWRLYLPRAKSKRGWRGRKGGSSVQAIKDRVPIHQRPNDIEKRTQPGHWEADLMLFSHYGHIMLALYERKSRLVMLVKQPDKTADAVVKSMTQLLNVLPEGLRRSCTFDNGTEFAYHYKLKESLGVDTYFCDPHAPWQKGGVENSIGRLRRVLPRKTNLEELSKEVLFAMIAQHNHTPRKCLDYKTPAEVFIEQLLHFKCESTLPPTRE